MLKCTKIDFGRGSAPDPAGPTSKGKEGEGEERREREGEEREKGGRGGEKGKEKEGRGERPYTRPVANSWVRHWFPGTLCMYAA